jgi:hypothetical protein
MRLSSFPEIGSKMVRRCTAPQPVLTRYKLLEIQRYRLLGTGFGHSSIGYGADFQEHVSHCLWIAFAGLNDGSDLLQGFQHDRTGGHQAGFFLIHIICYVILDLLYLSTSFLWWQAVAGIIRVKLSAALRINSWGT